MNDLFVPDPALVTLTAAALVAWFALVAVLWLLRLPPRPRPGPETTDLRPEQPALANLLAHGFNPTRDAVPATLVDLAARGLVEIEDRGGGNYFCRLTGRSGVLTPYERMLLDHLRARAAGGVVPAEALTTGPQDRSKAWWGVFRRKVVLHAQGAGFTEDLWTRAAKATLAAAGLVVLVLYGFATGFNDPEDVAPTPALDVIVLVGVGAAALLAAVLKSSRQISTEAGRAAATHWLGVRRALDESPSFDELPPSGVVVWERHLAYAAALGVAPRSIRSLPMGAESDTEAWTARSGEWRKVRVRYPRWRPGWGRHPALAVVVGAFGSYAGYNILRLAFGEIGFGDVWTTAPAAGATAIGAMVLMRSAPQALWGLADLFVGRRVEGIVLRARTRWSPFPYMNQGDEQNVRYFVAIDDGRDVIPALRVTPGKYARLPQGAPASLRVTPRLGYVALDPPKV